MSPNICEFDRKFLSLQWTYDRKDSLACHACRDTVHRIYRSVPKDLVAFIFKCQMFGERTVITYKQGVITIANLRLRFR